MVRRNTHRQGLGKSCRPPQDSWLYTNSDLHHSFWFSRQFQHQRRRVQSPLVGKRHCHNHIKKKDLLVGQTSHHCYHGRVLDIATASIESCNGAMYDGPDKLALGRSNKYQGEHTVSITSMGIHQEVNAKWTACRKKQPMQA